MYARDLFLFLFSPSRVPRDLSLSFSRPLASLSLSLFPSTDVDYKFSRPPERQRHESPDPRRDCEIEKRCRRTRRADSRPHHGPTPPPAKSPSQGRSPTGWPVMSLGETQQEFSPLSLSLPFRRLSICRSFLSLPCKRAPFLSVSFPLFLRLFADGSRPSSRLSTLSPVCRVYRVILFFFFPSSSSSSSSSPMLTPLHRFQLRFCFFAMETGW